MEERELVSGSLALDEEKVFPTERHQPERIFGAVVVEGDAHVPQKAAERAEIVPRVARGATQESLGPLLTS